MMDVYGQALQVCQLLISCYTCTGWAKKTGPFLIDDNFAAVNVRKACYMSKVRKFNLEKSLKLACLYGVRLNVLC